LRMVRNSKPISVRPNGRMVVDNVSFGLYAEVRLPDSAGPLVAGPIGWRPEFEVRSDDRVPVGIDGEPVILAPRCASGSATGAANTCRPAPPRCFTIGQAARKDQRGSPRAPQLAAGRPAATR
jgi:hypothetical protein